MIKTAVELKEMRKRLENNLKTKNLQPKTLKDGSAFNKLETKKKNIETKAFG